MHSGSSSVVSVNSTAQGSSSPLIHRGQADGGLVSFDHWHRWAGLLGNSNGLGSTQLTAHWLSLSHMAPPTLKGAGKWSPSWQPFPRRIPHIRRQNTLPLMNTQPSQPHCEFMSQIEKQRADIVNLNTASQICLKRQAKDMNLLSTEKQVPILMKHMKSGKPHSKLKKLQ